MQMLIEDDGTFEIIEITIVRIRVQVRDDLTPQPKKIRKDNITTNVMNVVRATSLAAIGVIQLAILLSGLGFHS